MSTKTDLIESGGPEIQPSVILKFMIKRWTEIAQTDHPKVPLVLQGLALSGLAGDVRLFNEYENTLSSTHLDPGEMIRRAVEIFHRALEGDPDNRPSQQPPPQEAERDSRPNVMIWKRVLMTALREGKIMEEQSDYRFVQVFEVLAWIGLAYDSERLAQFEEVRTSLKDDPEEMVKRARDILRDALFRRGAPGRVRAL